MTLVTLMITPMKNKGQSILEFIALVALLSSFSLLTFKLFQKDIANLWKGTAEFYSEEKVDFQ